MSFPADVHTLDALVRRAAKQWPHRTALELEAVTVTYAAFTEDVDRVAGWLMAEGVRRGDRVAVHLQKGIPETVACFAAARVGAVFVNINRQYALRQVEFILADSGARVLFADSVVLKRLADRGLPGSVDQCVAVGPTPSGGAAISWDALEGREPPGCPSVDRDLAAILYTSGSTGRSKGVMISHRNFLEGTARIMGYLKNHADDRVLSVLPLSAPWGVLQLTSMFAVGGTAVLQPVAFAVEVLKALAGKHITGLAAMPPTWVQLVDALADPDGLPTDFPSLRYITSSGGRIPERVLRALPQRFGDARMHLTYGLTEAFRSTVVPPEKFADKMGSLGQACPNVDVFVVDPEKGLCGPGERGELIHRGSLVTLGYWNRPEETAASFRSCPALKHLIGDEVVHYSGDLVEQDADGFYWFVERADNLIKCSGFRVSPAEVEDLVVASGLAAEAIAFGVEQEDVGQIIAVVVAGIADPDTLTDGLTRYCRGEMPTFMVPRRFHLWPEASFPIGPTGKIDRARVISTFVP